MTANTEFTEHSIYIMKNILLECCPDTSNPSKEIRPAGITCMEPILLTLCRYIRFLDSSVHTMTIKGKLCQLVEVVSHNFLLFQNRNVFFFSDDETSRTFDLSSRNSIPKQIIGTFDRVDNEQSSESRWTVAFAGIERLREVNAFNF